MNIVFLTNTYLPHVGGVARSVSAFAETYRSLGHKVLIVAPEFADTPPDEVDVIRVPALQNFNASDFSVALPIPTGLSDDVKAFGADIIHSHHPFLLGMTAVRLARFLNLPLVFTHHTLYEQYTHYVPGDSQAFKTFIIELATRYANLCDHVFAPSESIADLIMERGVTTPVSVIPTGVDLERFASGDRTVGRERYGIPADAFVIGHLGRLAPEKNLEFLSAAVASVLKDNPHVYFLLVGAGSSEDGIRELFAAKGLTDRLIMPGVLQRQELADALKAMDVFAFSSKSETQGMVLTEAMAAGLPVVGLDASGVREVVEDGVNGRLLDDDNVESFAEALQEMVDMPAYKLKKQVTNALATAKKFSMQATAKKALATYKITAGEYAAEHSEDEEEGLANVVNLIKAEWDILAGAVQSADQAISDALFGTSKK
ncbi:MAG: glycosyltransferase [Pseudomonadota bacterium]|nr:glycosyltransferase [Pseudomonadota bacterium]